MNISGISNAMNTNNVYNTQQVRRPDSMSSATKQNTVQNTAQKADAISSATIQHGGNHYFEAKV